MWIKENKEAIVVLIATVLLIIASIFLIHGCNKKIDRGIEEEVGTTEVMTTTESEPTTTTSTTTTTVKTTKKKTTTKKQNTNKKKTYSSSRVATASKAEYMAYAKSVGGYNDTQMQCLDYLWTHESGWNPNDVNKSSGACGIPQAHPCSKIKKQQGSNDWQAQIRWGINYINYRYKNPCGAWNHFKNKHWY